MSSCLSSVCAWGLVSWSADCTRVLRWINSLCKCVVKERGCRWFTGTPGWGTAFHLYPGEMLHRWLTTNDSGFLAARLLWDLLWISIVNPWTKLWWKLRGRAHGRTEGSRAPPQSRGASAGTLLWVMLRRCGCVENNPIPCQMLGVPLKTL